MILTFRNFFPPAKLPKIYVRKNYVDKRLQSIEADK